MAVQTMAAERNSRVEFLIQFILEKLCSHLTALGFIGDSEVDAQVRFESEIASDVWDHRVEGTRVAGNRPLQLWCQTTCYKGSITSAREPNKTYEVRETLVEALSIRSEFRHKESVDVRTLHFTVGDSGYTYQWFLDMKASTFDKSLYIGESGFDVFAALDAVLGGTFSETDKRHALTTELDSGGRLGSILVSVLEELTEWLVSEDMPHSRIADLQADLVRNEQILRSTGWPDLAQIRGVDIKGRTNRLVFNPETVEPDPFIPATASRLLDKNPFLSAAVEATSDWPKFMERLDVIGLRTHGLKEFVLGLWTADQPVCLLTRRLLLRIHTEDPVAYVQDRGIEGVTEHNLYSGNHTAVQAEQICRQIIADLSLESITTSAALAQRIGSRGRAIINSARWFEAQNGTQLKPSFTYVELALKEAGYRVDSPSIARLDARGFHAEIASTRVNAYANLKVIRDQSCRSLCVLKAKFFRAQEFPRRCKEEAFVGLTLKYKFDGQAFSNRLDIPLVMFLDMASDFSPPDYAVKRLVCFGWEAVFSVPELIGLLQGYCYP